MATKDRDSTDTREPVMVKRKSGETDGGILREMTRLRRSIFLARTEGLASMADAARSFLKDVADNEPISSAHTEGDVIRNIPDTISSAASDTWDEILEIPGRTVDKFYKEYNAPVRVPVHVGERRRVRGRMQVQMRRDSPEQRIIASARAYLNRIPNNGATINSVVDSVALETGYDRSIVRSMVLRHFVNNGIVVSGQSEAAVSTALAVENQSLTRMRQRLSTLGYTDLRANYPLSAFPGNEDTAALIAFDGDNPVVLCYPVDTGLINDPITQEAAKFQAGAVGPGKTARFVWVSDGDSDFFFDLEHDVVIPDLPTRVS